MVRICMRIIQGKTDIQPQMPVVICLTTKDLDQTQRTRCLEMIKMDQRTAKEIKIMKLVLRLFSSFEAMLNYRMKKINQEINKKENMFSNPDIKFPQRVFMKIFVQKQIMPSTLD